MRLANCRAWALCALFTACGVNETLGPGNNPLSRAPTVKVASVTTEMNQETFPNSRLNAFGSGTDSGGKQIVSGFSWSLDGVIVGREVTLSKVVVPGTYNLCLSALGVSDCVQLHAQEPKRIEGKIILATEFGGPIAVSQRVCAEWGEQTDCTDTDPTGSYSLLTRNILGEKIALSSQCRPGSNCEYLPSLDTISVSSFFSPQNIVVLKREWRMASGRWAGKAIVLSPEKGYDQPPGGFAPFFGRKAPATWAKSSFPVPVAFDRVYSTLPISSQDSTTIWNHLAELDSEFGVNLFRPAELKDYRVERNTGADPRYFGVIGVHLRDDVTQLGFGDTWRDSGDYAMGGIVGFGTNPLITFTRYGVKHEFSHALGLGHCPARCWFPGLMSAYQETYHQLYGVAIAEEVAHWQAFGRVRDLEIQHKAHGMSAIRAGERLLTLGLPQP